MNAATLFPRGGRATKDAYDLIMNATSVPIIIIICVQAEQPSDANTDVINHTRDNNLSSLRVLCILMVQRRAMEIFLILVRSTGSNRCLLPSEMKPLHIMAALPHTYTQSSYLPDELVYHLEEQNPQTTKKLTLAIQKIKSSNAIHQQYIRQQLQLD